ncbi:MAG TPA: hypothetical protein VMX13_16570, partial [Sedimentisphaerales bacterium]|nr:hypothetical protein [Sedimentisphaerales bacterium]
SEFGGVIDFDEMDVDTVREDAVVFDNGSEFLELGRADVVAEENGVGAAGEVDSSLLGAYHTACDVRGGRMPPCAGRRSVLWGKPATEKTDEGNGRGRTFGVSALLVWRNWRGGKVNVI